MAENVDVEITSEGGIGVVAFKTASMNNTEIITAAAEKIEEFIEQRRPAGMVIDFGGVKFFSSRLLGVLLDVRAKLQNYDAKVAISAINPQLHKVFRITNLDKVFGFFPDKETAVQAVGTN